MLLVLLAVTCGLLSLNRGQPLFSPVRMFLYGWLLVLGTAAVGMVRYDRPLTPITFVVILCALLAFMGGTYVGRKTRPAVDRPFGQPRDDVDRTTFIGLCVLAGVGIVLVAGELLGGGTEVLTNFAAESGRVRNEYFAEFASSADASTTRKIRSWGVVACLTAATLYPFAARNKHRLLQAVAAASAVAVALDSLLSAARFSLGALALCLLVSTALVYGDELRRVFSVRRVVIGGAIAFFFFVVFPTQRNPELAGSVERAVARSGDAQIADWVNGPLEVFAYSTSYFSTALDKLNYFVNNTDAFTWNTLGLYNFPLLDGDTTWRQIRLDIAQLMGQHGWNPNPWATGIRDLGIDFGLVGALAAIAILGYVAQTVYDVAVANRSFVGLITATYISVGCLVFAFISPFQIRVLSNGFWLLGALALAHWVSTGASLRKPRNQSSPTPRRS